MKTCTKCNKEKTNDNFYKTSSRGAQGIDSRCKECVKKYIFIYNRLPKVRKKNVKRELKRRRENEQYRIKHTIHKRMGEGLRESGKSKKYTEEMLGCMVKEYKEYIAKMFKEGMSWDNRGKWVIDHITPCIKFDLTKDEEVKKCFHFSNTQPLWKGENLTKGKRIL